MPSFAQPVATQTTTSTPVTLQDLLELVLPYYTIQQRRDDPGEEPTTSAMTFCRMPGEDLPHLGIAVRDPTLLDRLTRGLYRGLERTSTPLSTPLPEYTRDWLQTYIAELDLCPLEEEPIPCITLQQYRGPVIRHIVEMPCGKAPWVESRKPRTTLGQTGDRDYIMRDEYLHQSNTQLEPLTTLAVQVTSKETLDSFFDQSSLGAPTTSSSMLDIRLVKGGMGRILNLDGGSAAAVKMALHIRSTVNGRFGLLWAVPFFAVTELVEFEGRTHLVVSDVCSMTAIPSSPDAHRSRPIFLILISLFMSCRPEYGIDAPSDDDLRAWHGAAEQLDFSTALAPLRPMSNVDDAVVPLVHDAKTVIGLRHRPGSQVGAVFPPSAFSRCALIVWPLRQIVCDVETNMDSCMVAMGVELECDNFFGSDLSEANLREPQETPPVLPWFDMPLADAVKLDRLDLITPLGHGLTSMVWKAKWTRRSRPGVVRRSSRLANRSEHVPVVAKLVPATFASSVAREYFIYTQAVPQLSPEAQAYIPKFFGLYRSGWDGGGFVLVVEDVGEPGHQKDYASQPLEVDVAAQWVAAFRLFEQEGPHHRDKRPSNVLRHADGRLFIVDWGEACFSPSVRATLRAHEDKDGAKL
ncbi:BQ5605_C022g09569 [Microbotryum silenes-dioicae]|uniref:BQ5605_C022g09569 protein n=1 Tax=Microbotryum silenes-dioicae TaxID=796604 RepID=A0A2X0MPS2_9BASI|nr:BQ5605_C022g09569 [Microbotryum silenes-dioicae]